MRSLLLWVGLALIISSCVTNKKIMYLQKEDVNKTDNSVDTITRSYLLKIHEYKIQPLDILNIRIESLTEDEFDFMAKLYPQQGGGAGGGISLLPNSFLIDNHGEIEFPVIGKVKLSGLSVFEAQEKLQNEFKQFLKNPVARVRLLNFRFTVVGEVKQERLVVSDNTRITLMEAIGLSGGLTDLADRANVKIIRQKAEKADVFYMNLLDENLVTSDHFYIQQNDIIVVPPLKQRPFRVYWSENIAIIVSTLSLVLLTVSLFGK